MTSPKPISIWQPRVVDGQLAFERPAPTVFGDHYADRLQLRPRQPGDPLRICLFGESAAAGYLLAPHVTPAKALQSHLCQLRPDCAPEVIDLARTNERLESLVETVQRSFQLSPGLLVIFAGNNWNLLETPELSPYFPSQDGKQQIAQAMRDGGFEALAELGLRRRLGRAWSALAEIADVARAHTVPVVLVVPEVNLADWETLQPAPWLPGDGLARWYRHLDAARQGLRCGQHAAVIQAAMAMLDVDGGVSPTPYRLLAQAYTGQGAWRAARSAAEAEVASSHYTTICFLNAPQAGAAEQRLLRRAAETFGFKVVDLPALFAGDGSEALPGRRLFLDYCHLSVEGIHRAAAAIAVAALRTLENAAPPDAGKLLSSLPRPQIAPGLLATAQLGAAIHTAHRLADFLRKDELVRYWLGQALDTSPGVARTMLDVVAARASECPAPFTFAQQRILEEPYPLQHQHGWKYDHIDACLVQAITAELVERDPDLGAQATRLLLDQAPRSADLAEPRYLWEPLAQFYPELMPVRDRHGWATLRVPWPIARFAWVTAGTAALTLDIAARLPWRERGDVGVSVNGRHAGELALTANWSRTVLPVPAALLRPGLNRIAVHFPPPDARADVWSSVAERLSQGFEADLFPVFGELFRVLVNG